MSDINEMNEGMRWYVAHTYSGYENKVKANLDKIVDNRQLRGLIEDVRIPTERIIETDGLTEKEVENKLLPSYVFIKMIMCDESWHIVRNIRGVTGFVGPGSKPVPLSDEEVEAVLKETPAKAEKAFQIGDTVAVTGGLFTGFTGTLSEISPDGSEVTVIVSTVGRDMPVKLDAKDISKPKEE